MTEPVMDGLALASELDIPVHDFTPSGPARGRSVYLQGQLHANESGAMLVLHDLVRRLRSRPPANQVRVVPNANPIGWTRYLTGGGTGQGRISANGSNWNRLFTDPRGAGSTIDETVVATLWRLSETYDVIIDVHTPEFGWPHLYATSAGRRLTTMDDIPHVLYGAPVPGPFDECHLRLRADGTGAVWTSVTLEVPSHEILTDARVSHWSARLLREIDAQSECAEVEGGPESSGVMADLIPRISGAVVLQCQPGEPLAAGSPVLTVFGRKGDEETLVAPTDCIPVCFRRATVVEAGYWACRAISLH
ncbi:succinylglutamate desuccinylase/aspartoacylase family protein [Streptomyces prunicolor]|uniref:succinylglutamate desuccinylase/aspartoacylase domain-containing protein n=1 Tax=Streptomyces prunicolor TaxID=67348 RepID=UPI003713AF5D